MKRYLVSPAATGSFAVMILALAALPVYAVNHSGNINTQTWYAAENPHIIIGNVTVVNGDTLTIEAGCDAQVQWQLPARCSRHPGCGRGCGTSHHVHVQPGDADTGILGVALLQWP